MTCDAARRDQRADVKPVRGRAAAAASSSCAPLPGWPGCSLAPRLVGLRNQPTSAQVPGKEDFRPADSRCGAPDSGCAGRLAGALRPMASNRQAAFQIQPGTASPEATHRNACHMLAPASSIRSASQHHLAHQCQWTRPRPRRSGKYSPGSPYEREAIQIAASVRPEPPRNQRQTRRDRTAGQLSVPPFRSSYCEVHMTSIGHEERHNRTTIVELTRPLLPQTGRSRTPHRPSLVPRAGGGRKPFRLGPV